MTSPVETASELFVVGVSVEASVFTGPDTRALPVVTLHLQASIGHGAPPRDLHVHFQATGMEAIGDAIADAAVDAIAQADRRAAHSLTLDGPSPSEVTLPSGPSPEPGPEEDAAAPATTLARRLRNIGLEIDDVWQLVESEAPYPAAVPFLLEALHDSEPADTRFREGVVRALSIKQARPNAAATLVHEMRRQQKHDDLMVLWAFGNALSIVADDSVYDDIVELARDRSLGRGREMLMDALARMANPAATAVLTDLTDDGDVDGHAVVALARRPDAARDVLERFADDERGWVSRAVHRRLAAG